MTRLTSHRAPNSQILLLDVSSSVKQPDVEACPTEGCHAGRRLDDDAASAGAYDADESHQDG